MSIHKRSKPSAFQRLVKLISISGLFLLLSTLSFAGTSLPKNEGKLCADYAGLLSQGSQTELAEIQQTALKQQNTPIVVVTVQSMAQYGYKSSNIETFARDWFNNWQIGNLNQQGGAKKGILLIISNGDRRARIELDADWGRSWDGHCQNIMDNEIVPRFKEGDFNGGIMAGVASLASMSASGPQTKAPSSSMTSGYPFFRRRHGLQSLVSLTTGLQLSPRIMMYMFGFAVFLCFMGLITPGYRFRFFASAGLLTLAAFFAWIAIISIFILFIIFCPRGRYWGHHGHFGGGFGGGGGGFSGGGGASGGW